VFGWDVPLPTEGTISYWANLMTLVGVPIALLALLAAFRQLWLSQRTSSVSALLSLQDSLRDCWTAYLTAPPENRDLAFGELCNTIEFACAALHDRVFVGESRRVLKDYLIEILKIIDRRDFMRDAMLGLRLNPETFANISRFLTKNRRQFRSIGNPPA
jgi:hypothetical protein